MMEPVSSKDIQSTKLLQDIVNNLVNTLNALEQKFESLHRELKKGEKIEKLSKKS